MNAVRRMAVALTLLCLAWIPAGVPHRAHAAEETCATRIESFTIPTPAPNNRELPCAVRLPADFKPTDARVMVCFGGRNWDAERALSTYDFNDFADRHNIVLLSPGIKDDDYWQPEAWSGAALEEAIARIEKRYDIPTRPRLYYGYSAGGQCANLFYAHQPEKVAAWAAHACGVWFDPEQLTDKKINPAPALVTCGTEDQPRRDISRHFAYRYREAGGELVWLSFPGGHELLPEPARFAAAFFTSILESDSVAPPLLVGDDDSGQIHPADSNAAERIPLELRSMFRSRSLAEVWRRLARRD